MAFNQVSAASLTPSRPAPQAPQRRGTDAPTMYITNNALASSGYNASFALSPSSPSGSSYASSYSGIGGSPNRNSEALFNSHVVRNGTVSIKEDGFASWLWRPKWLVLKESTLSIHKTEVNTLVHFYVDHVLLHSKWLGLWGSWAVAQPLRLWIWPKLPCFVSEPQQHPLSLLCNAH